jgi:hypothetical protein
MMVEEGRDIPYIEHWHRVGRRVIPGAGVRLRDVSSGLVGVIVRSGDFFMYARQRPGGTTVTGRLIDGVKHAADLTAAQDCVDCEISYGQIDSTGWRIERSSLPYKENQLLEPTQDESGQKHLRTADVRPGGGSHSRMWEIADVQGSVDDVLGGPQAEFHT